MQLKLKRSQRDSGIVGKNVIFCLDARVEFTEAELADIRRYKLHKQVIYNSEATQKHLKSAAMSAATGSMIGGIKSLGSLAFAAMNLNISIESLQKGQHVECKSMDELLGAEEAILTACENLKVYLATAATFDGREVLFDFANGEPQVIATAHSPGPAAITSAAAPPPRIAAPETFAGEAIPAGVDPRYLPDLQAYEQKAGPGLFSNLVESVRDVLGEKHKRHAEGITFAVLAVFALLLLWFIAVIF